ncbi:uncharacterized protein J4E84_010674 [Alternaria hordeiaustralica]|uniref:uncharacterized protein n=1 Tax=Alternaria hordeiaustralica TaxID=1187925 RepID=UPI0020C575A4|nr:uncharacterized protein J4E84_010674 [Alternaria hordeiaustralica]KAI4674299.1 hypothetical protein J4E84_010674 [Alternaria hordeiaustralica]
MALLVLLIYIERAASEIARHLDSTMATSYEEDTPVLAEILMEIARNWSVEEAHQVFPYHLQPLDWDDTFCWDEAIASALLEVSRYRKDYVAVFEDITENARWRVGNSFEEPQHFLLEDVLLLVKNAHEQEAAGHIYRRADAMQGSYKEDTLEHLETTWRIEAIDIFPEDIRPRGGESVDDWFHEFIPILSAMSKVALDIGEVQREIRVAIENRKRHPKGIGRPKKQDQVDNIGIVRLDDVKDAHIALIEAHRMYNIRPDVSPNERGRAEESGRELGGEKAPEYIPEMPRAMATGRHLSDNDDEPVNGSPVPSQQSLDIDDYHQQTPTPQQREPIGRLPAPGLYAGSMNFRFDGLPGPPWRPLMPRDRAQDALPHEPARQAEVDERPPAQVSPAASQERRPRTPVERPTRQHEPSRSPHPSDGQRESRRSRSGTPPWERRRRERRLRRRREASEESSDDNERRHRAKRKRDIEDIGERIDSLNFGYDFAPQTPEEQLMKYEIEAESARFHAKRFKLREECLFAEGRARIAQRMADLQESRIRGAQRGVAADGDRL